jgi:hypothetical protein
LLGDVRGGERGAVVLLVILHRLDEEHAGVIRQYFDPSAPQLTASDAAWAIEKAKEALAGVKALLAASPPERFG